MTRTDPMHRTYEGRVLPRPEDEVVDQGLAFDLGTLFDRRRALQVLGIGVAGSALAACGSGSSGSGSASATASAASPSSATASASATASGALTEIPDETAGPYPGDGSNGADVLEQSGVVRADIRSSFGTSTTTAEGVPMTLTLTVLDIAAGGGPMVGAAVYVWHCDREGRYSMYSDGVTEENYLRGVQVTDDAGAVTFTSIVPACYSGRWPHIHFEVYPDEASITDSTTAIATSQVALPKATCDAVYATEGYEQSVSNLAQLSLTSDNVFGDDGGIHQLGTVSGSVSAGYAVALTAPVDTTTAPTGRSMGGSGGPGGAPPAAPSS
jgi:protocatechuate 3,4-dioxygenase beta subunit